MTPRGFCSLYPSNDEGFQVVMGIEVFFISATYPIVIERQAVVQD